MISFDKVPSKKTVNFPIAFDKMLEIALLQCILKYLIKNTRYSMNEIIERNRWYGWNRSPFDISTTKKREKYVSGKDRSGFSTANHTCNEHIEKLRLREIIIYMIRWFHFISIDLITTLYILNCWRANSNEEWHLLKIMQILCISYNIGIVYY